MTEASMHFDSLRASLRRARWWIDAWHAFASLRFAPSHLRDATRRTRRHLERARERLAELAS